MNIRKYSFLIILLSFLILLSFGCKKEDEEEDEEPYIPEVISAEHNISTYDKNMNSYIVLKGRKTAEGYQTSITFFSIIIKTGVMNITNRMQEFFQVDYINSNDKYECYFHQFDSIDGVERVYGQNFFPYYNYDNNSLIKLINVLVEYSYNDEDDINQLEQVKYQEEMLVFNESNYNDSSCEWTESSAISIIKESNDNEKFDRYKVNFLFDSTLYSSGHFDVQTWIEYEDGEILPFYGLYHYQVENGNYLAVSDEQIERIQNPLYLYSMINYYDASGNVTTEYIKEQIK